MAHNQSYITATGRFLPGEPVKNDEIEERLGLIGGRPSRARDRVLNQNKIIERYYAIDSAQQTQISNAAMAAEAVRAALTHGRVDFNSIELLAAATSQADLPLPGFASMVHGELAANVCEIASFGGICASSVAALRHASMAVRGGDVKQAVMVASEFASRLMKASRFEAQGYGAEKRLPFETEFLRWMLSDGAGAFLISNRPRPRELSLAIEHIELKSYAHQYPTCMFVGRKANRTEPVPQSWLDYPSYEAASSDGAINLQQTVDLLPDVVRMCVSGVFELVEAQKIKPDSIDWWCTHYSSHIFREQALELFERGGMPIPEDRIFSNLATVGNIGSAAFPVMIDGLLQSGQLKAGQRILCIVPESGRFSFGYVVLKVIGEDAGDEADKRGDAGKSRNLHANGVPPVPDIQTCGSELEHTLVRQLAIVWNDFQNRLRDVPIVSKIYNGGLTIEEYRELLFNLRQQVIDGSRWISRAASNVTSENFPIRSAFIGHSSDEHRDFEMIERDYVSIGGQLETIQSGTKNIGSAALSEYILSRASRENPFDLVGAMFIIEGLGRSVARDWGERIRDQLDLDESQVSFLMYHSESDDIHFQRLDATVQSGVLTPSLVEEIVKAAKVVARLYALQLEELGNS
ncbi:3-oxoacyl-[acyl-carrier-protein] synthase III C-terminal domain-containing protein [Stratiformator vulcanicus]|uniref:3-oxoacyl-(Acyl carrier protein) synthase III n=1 Tax=Stratiformator vulcanicus TaxID=2527980 RepID=A0A517R2A0_9PLAN|nr:3-oxoacyl-[acyl-carrier-protein] synthase III C-terminal domain-containing protein [Stratiformator vulcanicus]QDT38009.1 3-oxoacyl-(acyl carrier protein) synthase III [Stratiformator vulcanicus]